VFGGEVFGIVGACFCWKQFKIQVDRVVKMRRVGEEEEVKQALFMVSFFFIVSMFRFV
jgi:hypothetical protein